MILLTNGRLVQIWYIGNNIPQAKQSPVSYLQWITIYKIQYIVFNIQTNEQAAWQRGRRSQTLPCLADISQAGHNYLSINPHMTNFHWAFYNSRPVMQLYLNDCVTCLNQVHAHFHWWHSHNSYNQVAAHSPQSVAKYRYLS